MYIIFKKITASSDIPLEIKDLYLSSFPEEERREWSDIQNKIDSGNPVFSFYVLQHNTENIGFITLWRLPGALYCEHFAILHRYRGTGYGAAAVRNAIAMADAMPPAGTAALVLEVELTETSEMAARRIAFYERCGMTALTEFPYWQPPYRPGLPEVPLMLMTSRPLPDPTTLAIILHTVVYNQ